MRGILFAALLAPAFTITAYTASCKGCSGIAANGRPPVVGVSVACPREMKLGTWLEIEGLGARRCDDRGGDITTGRLDIFMATRSRAIRWGRRTRRVRTIPANTPKRPLTSTERADLGPGGESDAGRGSGGGKPHESEGS